MTEPNLDKPICKCRSTPTRCHIREHRELYNKIKNSLALEEELDEKIQYILNSLIRKRAISNNYDGIENATLDIKDLIANQVRGARRKEEHYWIDMYSREIKALDGFEDAIELHRLKDLRKLHQKRIAELKELGE